MKNDTPFDAFFILSYAVINFLMVGIAILASVIVEDFIEMKNIVETYFQK